MKKIKMLRDAELQGISAGMGTSNPKAKANVCANLDKASDKSNGHSKAKDHNPNYGDCGGDET